MLLYNMHVCLKIYYHELCNFCIGWLVFLLKVGWFETVPSIHMVGIACFILRPLYRQLKLRLWFAKVKMAGFSLIWVCPGPCLGLNSMSYLQWAYIVIQTWLRLVLTIKSALN